jgi:hypothetical protein
LKDNKEELEKWLDARKEYIMKNLWYVNLYVYFELSSYAWQFFLFNFKVLKYEKNTI